MLQLPRWRVDVTVGNDLVKTTYETATTSKAAIAKAKHKLRGAVSSAGRFKFNATKVKANEPARRHATKKSSAQLNREIAEVLAKPSGSSGDRASSLIANYSPWTSSYSNEDFDRTASLAHQLTNIDRAEGRPAPVVGSSKRRLEEAKRVVRDANRYSAASQTRKTSSSRQTHATKKVGPREWTARQMTSGRRVVEKARGNKIARLFQGEGHWTVTINRREPREPFETTGEITRKSTATLAAAKRLGTLLLKT
jgi:hypothetical protein